MKIVTNDYGCGTSSSILDYNIDDVIIVSEDNWEHIFNYNDDLFFVGHDFLMYIWDTEDKIKRLQNYPHAKLVWCFERIDSIVTTWYDKSHLSLSNMKKFADEILVCDEDDHENYGFKWLPQWSSNIFFEKRNHKATKGNSILFSGQAGKSEYKFRNILLSQCLHNELLRDRIKITNVQRSLSWEDYVQNFLSYNLVLNPVGVIKSLNTRAYEGLISGRITLQHQAGNYKKHQELLSKDRNMIFFNDCEDLVSKLEMIDNFVPVSDEEITASYNRNNIFARMKSIGVEIK